MGGKRKRKRGKNESVAPDKEHLHSPKKPSMDATQHLHKELQTILKLDQNKEGFRVSPKDDNIFVWEVYLFGFDEKTQIKQDLELYAKATGKDHVKIEILFPPTYPASPPFIRIVYPRFHQYTGHIADGALCVKDLTQSGWDSRNQLYVFIIMIRNLLLEGEALLSMDNLTEYTEAEARRAFARVSSAHGW